MCLIVKILSKSSIVRGSDLTNYKTIFFFHLLSVKIHIPLEIVMYKTLKLGVRYVFDSKSLSSIELLQ